MTATRLIPSPTLYEVLSDRLVCNTPLGACGYNTVSKNVVAGQPCPRCEGRCSVSGETNIGTLEAAKYTVDLQQFRGIGQCDCDNFAKHPDKGAFLARQPRETLERYGPSEREFFACKHIKFVKTVAGQEDNLNALLRALPEQEQHT